MAQHDMDIANGSGSAVRADINNALLALASTSKGPSAPSTAYAGQQWLDDNTPSSTVWTLSMYDGTAWRAMGTLSTTANVFVPNGIMNLGSASTTAIAPVGDGDTGIWSPGNDTWAVSTGGVERMRLTQNGLFGFGTTPSYLMHVSNLRDDTVPARLCVQNTNAAGGSALLMLRDDRGASNYKRITFRNVQGVMYLGRFDDTEVTFTEWSRWVDGSYLVGATATDGSTNGIAMQPGTDAVIRITNASGTRTPMGFYRAGGSVVGSITTTDSATSYNTSSDERLKRDTAEITAEQAEAAIRGLRPLLGRFNVEPDDAPLRPMYLAHEYQEVVPHAVSGERGGTSMMAAQYGPVSPLYAAALQSLLDRVAALEARVGALEA